MIEEIEDIIGIPADDAIRASAKTGEGVDDILEAVIARIRPPKGDPTAPLSALIIDSWFDNYVGVVMLVRVMDGTLKARDKVLLMASGATYICEQVGVFTPKAIARDELSAGGVGFVIAGIKELKAARVGDTLTLAARPALQALPGFKEVKPQVFAGLYPVESNQYEDLRDALEKLKLNDASLHYEPEVCPAALTPSCPRQRAISQRSSAGTQFFHGSLLRCCLQFEFQWPRRVHWSRHHSLVVNTSSRHHPPQETAR